MITQKGKEIPVKASIFDYHAFSTHADLQDILSWLVNQDKKKVRLVLVHGNAEALKTQQEKLTEAGFKNVKIAQKGEAVSIEK
jgi:Cft2 family RNA processing exonuclease